MMKAVESVLIYFHNNSWLFLVQIKMECYGMNGKLIMSTFRSIPLEFKGSEGNFGFSFVFPSPKYAPGT